MEFRLGIWVRVEDPIDAESLNPDPESRKVLSMTNSGGGNPRHYDSTCNLDCSSFFGLPFGILNMELVQPKNGTAMETIGIPGGGNPRHYESIFNLQGLYWATRT